MSTGDQVDSTTSGLTRKEELIKSITNAIDQSRTKITRIEKIPGMLHGTNDFEKYFVPRVVSFGPYHHDKDELRSAETLKLKFTNAFTDGKLDQMMKVYDKILEDIENLRDCYDEEPTKKYNDEDLAGMLFVDGCSVLHYIHCYVYGELWMFKDNRVAFMHQDLFLLENQLPLQVLEMLAVAKYDVTRREGMKMIRAFIVNNISTGKDIPTSPGLEPSQSSHLLDLLRKVLIGYNTNKEATRPNEYNSIYNVTKLTAVGIHVKPSDTNCLGDVSFLPGWITGHLKLPPIFINHLTKPKFLNMIAYEMCPNVPTDFEVTSYVCFLASLISHSDDVKMLQAAGTLHNSLGTNEVVAELFKEISAQSVPNTDVYRSVIREIGKYFSARRKVKMATWLVELNRVYFRNPWTIISILSGFIVISASVIQAYYTRYPVRDK